MDTEQYKALICSSLYYLFHHTLRSTYQIPHFNASKQNLWAYIYIHRCSTSNIDSSHSVGYQIFDQSLRDGLFLGLEGSLSHTEIIITLNWSKIMWSFAVKFLLG